MNGVRNMVSLYLHTTACRGKYLGRCHQREVRFAKISVSPVNSGATASIQCGKLQISIHASVDTVIIFWLFHNEKQVIIIAISSGFSLVIISKAKKSNGYVPLLRSFWLFEFYFPAKGKLLMLQYCRGEDLENSFDCHLTNLLIRLIHLLTLFDTTFHPLY